MEISTIQFQQECLRFLEEVHSQNTEIVITKHGKPFARLVPANKKEPHSFLGSLMGVGTTIGDLTEPLEDEWECD